MADFYCPRELSVVHVELDMCVKFQVNWTLSVGVPAFQSFCFWPLNNNDNNHHNKASTTSGFEA